MGCDYSVVFWQGEQMVAKVKKLDGRYAVRDDGVVLSDGMALKAVRGVWVSLRGERRDVAYLVARAFVPNAEGRAYVRHRNGDRTDNRAENLEWSDEQEGGGKRGRKARVVPFGQFDSDGELVARYLRVSDASEATGLDPHAIRAALGRKRGRSGNWYWMYL